jgi:CubicO group peptidase (beta-lactamase class C family)
MSSDPIRSLLEERIAGKEFPSAVWLAATGDEIVSRGALGSAQVEPEFAEASFETIYDLASLTKPLVTGLICAILFDRGELRLSDHVLRYIPQFGRDDKNQITIEDLLTHRSGLEAWRPFYLETGGAGREERLEAVVRRISELPLEYQTGTRVVYSDLNFILLGSIIEKQFGKPLDSIAISEIFAPLGLERTFFNPPKEYRDRIAASESGNEYEKQTAAKMGFEVGDCKWRKGTIRGEVHDGNCYYLGGVAGHAGLFSDAAETHLIARQFISSSSSLLEPEACTIFRENLTVGLDQSRSAAFQLASTKSSSANGALPAAAFGHLGFTGTLLWIEPDSESIFILLTNRTHAKSPPFADLSDTRRRFLRTAYGLTASQTKDVEAGPNVLSF